MQDSRICLDQQKNKKSMLAYLNFSRLTVKKILIQEYKLVLYVSLK